MDFITGLPPTKIKTEEVTNTNSLKRLVLYLKSIIVVGEIEVSNLYKTFLDLLL